MNDLQIERLAQTLAEQLRAGRRATFTSSNRELRNRLIARVQNILAGRTLEETPD